MTIAPPRRKSRIVFWIAALAVISAVLATALLANDKHNLRLLAERYHWTWLRLDETPSPIPQAVSANPPAAAPKKEAQETPPEPAAQRGARVIAVRPVVGQPVSLRLFADPKQNPSDFVRRWKVSGVRLCDEIAAAGISMSRWHPAEFADALSECSMETPVSPTDTSADPPSLFAIIRGTQKGEIQTIRMKAVLPETAAGNAMKDRFLALVRLVITETQWLDFKTAADRIGKLQDVTQSTSGVKLTFAHEMENPRRFNLLLEIDLSTPEMEQTAAFFDATKRFPLPRHP